MFIAEIACSPTGGDKAAWLTDMFNVVPTKFPRFIGITWFNANKERDWRIESSTASLQACIKGLTAWAGVSAQALGAGGGTPVATSPSPSPTAGDTLTTISIASSAMHSSFGRSFLLSGVLTPGKVLDPCNVEVKKPGSVRWSYSSTRLAYDAAGTWWYRYMPFLHGTYQFRVKFAGDAERAASGSRVIDVTVI